MSSILRNSIDNVKHMEKPLDEDLLELVHAVMHEYRTLQYRFLKRGSHDITHMDGKVLGFFAHRPDATLSDLAQHSGRDKAQLARLIKGLRERGLLEGRADSADRRNLRLQVTAAGRELQRGLQQQARRLSTRAVADLDATERARLLDYLQRMKRNLERENEA